MVLLIEVFCIVFAVYFSVGVEGHGYLIHPSNRASLWRINANQPTNFNDNEYFCGGTYVQYYTNEGKCGPCGDNWNDPVPRSNENGGLYGNGIVMANYTAGSIIDVSSVVTANHLGSLYFHVCKLENASLPETEDCFHPLRLADGSSSQPIGPLDLHIETKLQLPKDLVCDRCVLRWHYRTGNSWGMCEDGTQNVGCGNQEIFRSCADIRIVADDSSDDVPEDPDVPDDGNDDEPNDDDDEEPGSDDEQPCIVNPKYTPHKPHKPNKHHKRGL